jgi:nucleotide-binding universal stress UspA family protein
MEASEMRRFKNILCVIEHGEASRSALERAVALAETNQARLTVVDVVPGVPYGTGMPDGGPSSAELQAAIFHEHEKRMQALVEPFLRRVDIQHKLLQGTSFLGVIREVLRSGHDLVVKCPESPSWLNRFFSGDDMHLLRKCPCPVWLVKSGMDDSYRRILAAVDLDDNYPPEEIKTRQALNGVVMELAGALAVSEFAELHVVYNWAAFGESSLRESSFMSQPEAKVNAYVDQLRQHHLRLLDTFIQETGAKLGPDAMDYIKPQRHLLKGSARREVPALAKELQVDCIVMGTVARTGVRGFIMGNTAETILAQLDCSVLAVKPPGFETPVSLED